MYKNKFDRYQVQQFFKTSVDTTGKWSFERGTPSLKINEHRSCVTIQLSRSSKQFLLIHNKVVSLL